MGPLLRQMEAFDRFSFKKLPGDSVGGIGGRVKFETSKRGARPSFEIDNSWDERL